MIFQIDYSDELEEDKVRDHYNAHAKRLINL
jgi:hypothetical protein